MNETLGVYARMAGEYVALTADHSPAGLQDFIAAMPKGAAVLDLGCGPGQHAAIMAKAGLEVYAIDATAEMVALADQHDGVEAQIASFDDIADMGEFDGVWASFSLLHAARDDFERHLADLYDAILPGGLLVLGMKLGTGEAPDSLGRHYTYYTEAELRSLLRDAGFAPATARFGADKGLAGDTEDWIVIDAYA